MNIEDFYVKYPLITFEEDTEDGGDDFDFYPNESLQQVLFNKREFYDQRLPDVSTTESAKGDGYSGESDGYSGEGDGYSGEGNVNDGEDEITFLKQQKFVARFLSSYTPYTGLLLFHEPGTGKTFSGIALFLLLTQQKSSISRCLILVPNNSLIDNWKNEIIKATGKKYIPINPDPKTKEKLTEEQIVRRKNSLLSNDFQFSTYETFATSLAGKSEDEVNELFSNHLIILDEVHNIRPIKISKKKNNNFIYDNMHRLLHTAQNIKVLLLTGTPMRDKPEEISEIMNLLLPMTSQLPTGEKFIKTFLEKNPDETYSVILEKKKLLKDLYFRGYVSYLKTAKDNDVEKLFVTASSRTSSGGGGGSGGRELEYFITYNEVMSDFQSLHYSEAFSQDKRDTEGIYSHSVQAALFVFPDGSFGGGDNKNEDKKSNEGFSKYVMKKTKKTYVDKQITYQTSYILEPAFAKEFTTLKNDKARLKLLKKYSIKYYTLIRQLLKHSPSSSGKKSGNEYYPFFVYCKYVEGGGIILLSKILELFGYIQNKGTNPTSIAKRFALVYGGVTPKQTRDIIASFNDPKNIHGEYIQVIIGSKVIGEGFSLRNVRQVHILTGHWNYAEIDQAISRAIRYGSHSDYFTAEGGEGGSGGGGKVELSIYQHLSIPKVYEDDEIYSVDFLMYEKSQGKDISIKAIERLMIESAVDCELNKLRNTTGSAVNGGSRECEYTTCEYICDGITSIESGGSDESSYFLYVEKKPIVNAIKRAFVSSFSYTLEELVKFVEKDLYGDSSTAFGGGGGSRVDVLSLFIILKDMIGNVIDDKYGFESYLIEYNNMFYLNRMPTESAFGGSTSLNAYYTQYIPLYKDIPFNIIQKEYYSNYIPYIIDAITTTGGGGSGGGGSGGGSIDERDLDILINKLPKTLREQYIECALSSLYESTAFGGGRGSLIDWILKTYSESIITLVPPSSPPKEVKAEAVDTAVNGGEDQILTVSKYLPKLRCLTAVNGGNRGSNRELVWKDCEGKVASWISLESNKKTKELEDNPYGYYGIYDRKSKEFLLRNLTSQEKKVSTDGRDIYRGKRCKNWPKRDLMKVINRIKLPYDEKQYAQTPLREMINAVKSNKKKFEGILDGGFDLAAESTTTKGGKGIEKEDLARMMVFCSYTIGEICEKLQEWFIQNNLVEYR